MLKVYSVVDWRLQRKRLLRKAFVLFYPPPRTFFFSFRERGREGGRERETEAETEGKKHWWREKHPLVAFSYAP